MVFLKLPFVQPFSARPPLTAGTGRSAIRRHRAPLAWHFFSGEPPQKLAVSRLLGRGALRMAGKLRSYERQTTPPGRGEELLAPKTWKQHNFLTGSPEKKCHARGALCLRTALRPVPAVRGGRTEKRLDKRQLWENWTWQAQRTVIEYH